MEKSENAKKSKKPHITVSGKSIFHRYETGMAYCSENLQIIKKWNYRPQIQHNLYTWVTLKKKYIYIPFEFNEQKIKRKSKLTINRM